MSRPARLAVAILLAASAAPAAAFHRTETGTPGRCLWWARPSVTYRLNASIANTVGCGSLDAVLALARSSLATWASAAPTGQPVCTDFGFVDGGTSTSQAVGNDGENLIVWRQKRCSEVAAGDPCLSTPGACADKFGCWEHGDATIGLTTTSYRPDTGEILDADMELNDHDPTAGSTSGYWFTCPATGRTCGGNPGSKDAVPNGSCISMDLGSTVTHEAGHMLGLAHPCQSASSCPLAADTTMYGTAAIGQTTKRVLKDDDVAGVCTIYPAGGSPQATGGVGDSGTACAAAPAPAKSGGGCGLADAGADDAAVLAALAGLARLWRRRRTR